MLTTHSHFKSRARSAGLLSHGTAMLALICAAAGLIVPDFYGLVNPVLLPGTYGQDWMSLAAVPALVWAIRSGGRHSLRGLIVWIGLLAYYLYAYALYAFGPQYTVLYPLYVAVVGLSALALVMVALSLDVDVFDNHLRGPFAARWTVALFVIIVASLAPAWIAMMIAAMRRGIPSLFTTIHVLDLAFVFPAMIVAAVGLWGHRPWSYALAGPLLILSATMMGSLVVSEVIAAVRFTPDPLPLSLIFTMIALAASWLIRSYLRLLPA